LPLFYKKFNHFSFYSRYFLIFPVGFLVKNSQNNANIKVLKLGFQSLEITDFKRLKLGFQEAEARVSAG